MHLIYITGQSHRLMRDFHDPDFGVQTPPEFFAALTESQEL